jgi:hypothetical protein
MAILLISTLMACLTIVAFDLNYQPYPKLKHNDGDWVYREEV